MQTKIKSKKSILTIKEFLRAIILSIVVVICVSTFFFFVDYSSKSNLKVCFTPAENCSYKVVEEINSAKKSIYLQAYYLTSEPIITALFKSQERGVSVYFILDRQQRKSKYLPEFIKHKIPVFFNKKAIIAHNKVIIIDGVEVITGSANFTDAAQYSNNENIVFIKNSGVAKKYLNNWKSEAFE